MAQYTTTDTILSDFYIALIAKYILQVDKWWYFMDFNIEKNLQCDLGQETQYGHIKLQLKLKSLINLNQNAFTY